MMQTKQIVVGDIILVLFRISKTNTVVEKCGGEILKYGILEDILVLFSVSGGCMGRAWQLCLGAVWDECSGVLILAY